MVVKIGMNVLGIQGLILKANRAANWQKKLRTAILKSKYIGSKKV